MIPPCDDCRPVSLEKNDEAIAIYGIVCNQIIVAGMGDVIDLDDFEDIKEDEDENNG